MENLFELLNEALEQLMDMWRVADDSVADYTLQIETAVNFINKALKTQDRLDIFKALQKSYDVLEKEYNETPDDEEYDDLVDRIKNALNGLDETKNYIKEFSEYQSKHPVSVKHEFRSKEEPIQDSTKIEEKELKNLVTEAVINFMNHNESETSELLYEHKKDLVEKVKLYENRNGFLGMYFTDDKELNECSIGAIIDPTNRRNWVAMKQETFYKLPYCYKDSLRQFVGEIRNSNNKK